MSDYLARLAARALGTAAIVTPRPAAVFAPVAHPAIPEPRPNDAAVGTAGSLGGLPENMSSSATIPAPESAADSHPMYPMHVPAIAPLEEHASPTSLPAEASTVPVPPRPGRDGAAAGRDAPPPMPPTDSDAVARAQPGHVGALAAAPRIGSPAPPAIMAAPAWNSSMAGRLPVSRRAPPETAPTVHISIGRVEVRATRAASGATKTPRKTEALQQLSLGDYLRRGGGGRR